MENPDNAGLQRAIDAMENVKAQADAAGIVISRADLWALAGKKTHYILVTLRHEIHSFLCPG